MISDTEGRPYLETILIHGGSFRAGSKADYGRTWGPYLAARGYVVFAIDYRLSTPQRLTWPQALLDAKAAVQYVRGHAAVLGVNPDRIAIGGDSAGATLASLVALALKRPRLHGHINTAFFVLTLVTVLAFEGLLQAVNVSEAFTAEARQALRTHLYFSVPSALLLPAMFVSGKMRLKRLHLALALGFTVLWAGTVVTGLGLPH